MDRFSNLLQRRPEGTPAYGHFARSFVLPDDVEEAKLSADYVDGVFRVNLPNSPVVKPKANETRIK